METVEKCWKCEKKYNGTNKLKLSCPACKSFFRCREWFKELNFKCDYCKQDWGVKGADGDLECPDLDFGTARACDTMTIILRANNAEFKVNKNKTFRVLIALIRFGMYKRKAENEGRTPDEVAQEFEDKGHRLNLKFFRGEKLLFENDLIESLGGDHATIDHTLQYIGGQK